MKNTLGVIIAIAILFIVSAACGSINPLSKDTSDGNSGSGVNKTMADRGVDTIAGDEKIGVPECDEVMDMLTAESNNPDDNFVVKAGKAMFFNKIKEGIKKSVEKNKNDTEELAKNCRDFKTQLDKYKAEAMDKEKK